jgi:hypothetical protein
MSWCTWNILHTFFDGPDMFYGRSVWIILLTGGSLLYRTHSVATCECTETSASVKKLQFHHHLTISRHAAISIAANSNFGVLYWAALTEIVRSSRLSQCTHIMLTLLAAAGGAVGGAVGGASTVGGANYSTEILRAS